MKLPGALADVPVAAVGGALALLLAAGWFFFLRKPNMAKLAKKSPEKFLRKLDAFKGLSPEDFATVQGLLEKQTIKPGGYLFKEGDKGSSFFIVAAGGLKLTKETAGKRNLLKTAVAGDVIGEMALLTGQPRTASAQAVGETSVFKLDRVKFADLKQRSQVLIDQIWRTYTYNTLDNYLRNTADWVNRPSRLEFDEWFAKQMPFSVDMGQKLMVPDGAGMLFAVTGKLSVNEQEVNAPKLIAVSFESKLLATRTGRIVWFGPHPAFVANS